MQPAYHQNIRDKYILYTYLSRNIKYYFTISDSHVHEYRPPFYRDGWLQSRECETDEIKSRTSTPTTRSRRSRKLLPGAAHGNRDQLRIAIDTSCCRMPYECLCRMHQSAKVQTGRSVEEFIFTETETYKTVLQCISAVMCRTNSTNFNNVQDELHELQKKQILLSVLIVLSGPVFYLSVFISVR